jgi:hypothetical protein
MEFPSVTVVPKYLNCSTLTKYLLSILPVPLAPSCPHCCLLSQFPIEITHVFPALPCMLQSCHLICVDFITVLISDEDNAHKLCSPSSRTFHCIPGCLPCHAVCGDCVTQHICLFCITSTPALWSIQPHIQWLPRVYLLGGKAAGA